MDLYLTHFIFITLCAGGSYLWGFLAGEKNGSKRSIELFLDDNDLNEKAIIGFISFTLMTIFGITDLVTALVWDMDLKVSETIYTSFVVVTLGAFGISEAGKAFGGK